MIFQLSAFLENRTGQLSEIIDTLSDNGIDLRAVSIAETADYGVLRLIVSDPHRASEILLQHGFLVSLTPVVPVMVADRPGALGEVLHILAREGVDLEYMYSVLDQGESRACMIFCAKNMDQLRAAMEKNGLQEADGLC